MSRLLTILLITCLMATAVMGLTASQQRLRARTAIQYESSLDSDLTAAAALDTTHDMDSTSNMHIDADIDADVDGELDTYADSESDMNDMTEEGAFLEATSEMDMDQYADNEAEADADADAQADIYTDLDADAHADEQEQTEEQVEEQVHDQSHEQVQVAMDASHDASSMASLEATTSDTSLLESQSSVSYIAFGDKGLQGSNTEYGVIVDKQPCGVAVGVTGGLRYYDIIETTDPKTGIQKKKFGQRNFATINVAFDRPNAVLTSWIKDTLDGKYSLRTGAVQADDGKGNLKASLSFDKAYISKVTFPKFDLTDDRPAIWKIAISPQMTHLNQAEDGAQSGFRDMAKKFKPYGNNFRLTIDNKVVKGVRVIESFEVETRRATDNIKPLYKVGNLVFEVSQAEAGDLFFWMEKQHTKKKDGAITVYKPSGKVFYSIALKGMGVYKVHPMRAAPRQIRWLRVEIFCEQVSFVFDPKPAKKKAPASDDAQVVEEKTESITVIDDIPA